ncbi:unnamed protein product, partial [Pleuronectes platessa]
QREGESAGSRGKEKREAREEKGGGLPLISLHVCHAVFLQGFLFIRGTCQGRLPRMGRRARQIRITETETVPPKHVSAQRVAVDAKERIHAARIGVWAKVVPGGDKRRQGMIAGNRFSTLLGLPCHSGLLC